MKNLFKIISLFVLTVIMQPAVAQNNIKPLLSTTNGLALDTVPGNGSRTFELAIPGAQAFVTITAKVTEISGTTAGTVKLYAKMTGSGYALVPGSATFSPADQAGDQYFHWEVVPSKYTDYQLIYAGTGTMSAKFSASSLVRGDPPSK